MSALTKQYYASSDILPYSHKNSRIDDSQSKKCEKLFRLVCFVIDKSKLRTLSYD